MNRLRFIFLAFLCFWIAIAIPSARDSLKAMPPNSTLNLPLSLQRPHQNSINPNLPNSFKSLIDGENTAPLLQQAKAAYENEDYHNAVMLLEQAVEIFVREGEDFKRAIALSNLSLAYQKLGEWKKAEDDINLSIKLLKMQEQSPQNSLILAQSFNIQGRLWYEKGQTEQALQNWQEAEQVYRELSNSEGIIASKINQIQALQTLGLFQRSRDLFGEIESAIAQLPDSRVKIKALRSFGDLLRNLGELNTSQERANCQLATENRSCDSEDILQKSLEVAKRAKQSASPSEIRAIDSEIGAVLLSLGNTVRAKGNLLRDRASTSINFDYLPWRYQTIEVIPQPAQQFYQDAAAKYRDALATSSLSTVTKIQAQLNLLGLLVELGNRAEIESLAREIDIAKLPPSRASVYAKVNLAKNLAFWQQKERVPAIGEIKQLLERALQEAKELEDKRAESYVVGNLGGFYEYRAWQEQPHQSTQNINSEDWQQAEKFTHQALNLIQPLESPDLAYQWEWQLGRLLVEPGQKESAIASYKIAVRNLEQIRFDLLAINSDAQFSFRDNVEPLYRQMVELLLTADRNNNASLPQQNIAQALELIDSLQLAELENFLGCNLGKVQDIDRVDDPHAAYIYPIFLKNRLAIIFQPPGQPSSLEYRETPISYQGITTTVRSLREKLETPEATPEVLEEAKKVYQWLIKPLDSVLAKNSPIQTLVFVLDGDLRNIPMGVLYDDDSERYLIQDYAIAVAPRLKLFAPQASQQKLNIFLGGVSLPQTIEGKKFESIRKLEEELNGIVVSAIPTGELILNERFTQANIRAQFQERDFSAIHWKTHGIFSSNPEETYIIAYQEIISARDLSTLIRAERSQPLELLVLSACETAKGDRRAVLGLAGIAVQSGARTALSTLWKADDAANTELMIDFYQQLSQDKSRAQALREAQLSLIEQRYTAPHLWATYILVGNWL